MLRLLGPDGESNPPLTEVVALKLTVDGADGPYLPVDGLENPTSTTLDRKGADIHLRVEGGDAAGSWFCDYFIDKRVLTKRACGPAEIGEPTEITTYVERFLE